MKVVVVFDESIIDVDVGDDAEDEGYDDAPENGLDVHVENDVVKCPAAASDAVADGPAVLKVDDDGNNDVSRDAANASLRDNAAIGEIDVVMPN